MTKPNNTARQCGQMAQPNYMAKWQHQMALPSSTNNNPMTWQNCTAESTSQMALSHDITRCHKTPHWQICTAMLLPSTIDCFFMLTGNVSDRILIKMTTQTTSLHWQDDQNKTTAKLERKTRDQHDNDGNDKMNDKDARWASKRELRDESSTRLHYL